MQRTLKQREKVLLGAVAVALVLTGGWWFLRPGGSPIGLARPRPSPSLEPIPRIDLARLDQPRPETEAGRRDVLAFGSARDDERPASTPVATPPPAVTAPALGALDPATGMPVAATPRLPPLNLKYIGSVENKAGVKVAVLVTDRNEVLTGQAGQVLANRYKIARIGLESIDLEEVGTGQSRRIPLKGN